MNNKTGITVENELEVDGLISDLNHGNVSRDDAYNHARFVIKSDELFKYFIHNYKKSTEEK